MKFNLNREAGSAFGLIVEAQYGEGYVDKKAALMDWDTYAFLVQLNVASEPISPMNYSVIYATRGRANLTGNMIPSSILELPNILPVAVKSSKIRSSELGRLLGLEYLPHIWHNSDLVPCLAALGLMQMRLGVGVEINVPYHAVSNGRTGRDKAYFFEY